MEEKRLYKLTRIEGEYAYLSDSLGEELFISMMLLPEGADIGSALSYTPTGFELEDKEGQ